MTATILKLPRWLRGWRDRGASDQGSSDTGKSRGDTAGVRGRNETSPSASLPAIIAAIDIETTGRHSTDRMVSIAAVKMATAGLLEQAMDMHPLHLIFDPGRRCDPKIEAALGYEDWLLRHQDEFGAFAQQVIKFLSPVDLIIAHDGTFIIGFLARELARLGRKLPSAPTFCTMQACKKLNISTASLDAACRQLKIKRDANLTDAFGDAWLTLRLYLHLNKFTEQLDLPDDLAYPPTNLRDAPPKPLGALPPRLATGLRATG